MRSMSGKETQENWALQSVKNGKRRGVSVYESGYLVQHANVAELVNAPVLNIGGQKWLVGSNPTVSVGTGRTRITERKSVFPLRK